MSSVMQNEMVSEDDENIKTVLNTNSDEITVKNV